MARVLRAEFDPFELRPWRDAARLHQEGVPLLIVHSREDRVIPVEHARLLAAAHPEAALWEVEGCAHTAAYAHPEYRTRLSDFLCEAMGGG
jgi:pimeloyl-ACP methyl ester carboxylesterase